jgi:hypothetical protein
MFPVTVLPFVPKVQQSTAFLNGNFEYKYKFYKNILKVNAVAL